MKPPIRLLPFFAAASLPICPVLGDDKPADEGGTSVWRVQAEDGKAKLYLAGSIHLLREEDHPLPEAFEEAYRSSEVLVLEIASEGDEEDQVESMRRGMYPEGENIRDDLSPRAYRELRKYLEAAGLPPNAMDGFRPWMAAMMISLTEMMKLGGKAELGADSFFEGRAIADGKPVRSLETSEFQIGLFATLGKKEQESLLSATLRDMAKIETEFPRMIEAWRTGDDATLDAIMHESMKDMPELRTEVLDKRNARWVERLEKMLRGDRDVMVVVGAGHLVGERGVVSLLRGRGYRIERVRAGGKQRDGEKPKRFIEL